MTLLTALCQTHYAHHKLWAWACSYRMCETMQYVTADNCSPDILRWSKSIKII